jgi:hypothetical protein
MFHPPEDEKKNVKMLNLNTTNKSATCGQQSLFYPYQLSKLFDLVKRIYCKVFDLSQQFIYALE